MSFKDLSKSLVDSVNEVVVKSNQHRENFTKKIFEQGLKMFNANNINDLSETEQKMLYSWAFNAINESSCGCSDVAEDDMPDDSVYHKTESSVSEDTTTEDTDDLKENVILTPDQLHTNTAVGVRDVNKAMPIHADVLKDSSPMDGKTEYRLFVQFNTNTLPIIVPPVTLPGAPSVEALKQVVEGLPYYGEAIQNALVNATDVPASQPQFKGNDRA